MEKDPELKRAILNAAFELVHAQPGERVSLRAVAERAGCDASLVGYYFGSRSGLMAAVAERAAERFNAQLDLAYRPAGEIADRIASIVREPVRALAGDRYLAQLFVDELIIHGDDGTDAVLHKMAAPFHERLRELIGEGRESGELREVDGDLLLYALAILPLLYHFLAPIYERAFGDTGVTRDPREFTDGLLDLITRGILTGHDDDRA